MKKKNYYGKLYYDYLYLYSEMKKKCKTTEEFNLKMQEARKELLSTNSYDRRTKEETQF